MCNLKRKMSGFALGPHIIPFQTILFYRDKFTILLFDREKMKKQLMQELITANGEVAHDEEH